MKSLRSSSTCWPVRGEVAHNLARPCKAIATVRLPVASTCGGMLLCRSTPIACQCVPGKMRRSMRFNSLIAGSCLAVLHSRPC
eukprot:5208420-Amphidinium_carterae.2